MPEHTKRLLVRVNPALRHPHERTLSLDGKWLFRLDPQDEGLDAQWFKDQGMFSDAILVPGCWQGQGYGHDGEDEVWDFRLRARTLAPPTRERTGMASCSRLQESGGGRGSGSTLAARTLLLKSG